MSIRCLPLSITPRLWTLGNGLRHFSSMESHLLTGNGDNSNIPSLVDKNQALDTLYNAFKIAERGKVLVLTGAGISTDSGVPDYRGPRGTYTLRPGHRPINFSELMDSDKIRQRYWSRSYFGLTEMKPKPNKSHYAIAQLQNLGYVRENWLITQNVDSLHLKARMEKLYGVDNINFQIKSSLQDAHSEYQRILRFFNENPNHELELHGSLRDVICMGCGSLFDGGRQTYQFLLTELNEPIWGPNLQDLRNLIIDKEGGFITNADGDAESESLAKGIRFDYPLCNNCFSNYSFKNNENLSKDLRSTIKGSVLQSNDSNYEIKMAGQCNEKFKGLYKPTVVFFGENMHEIYRNQSINLAENCDLLLVLGTSVQTFSAYRLILAAKARNIPIYMINSGPTRADALMTEKWEVGLSEILPILAEELS